MFAAGMNTLKRPLLAAGLFGAIYVHFEILSWLSPSWCSFYDFVAKSLVCTFFAGLFLDIFGGKILKDEVNPKRKAVFITGCDSGFGHLLAKRLDSKGFVVFAGCLFPEKDGALELKHTCSKRLHIVQVDVTKDDSVQRAKDFIQDNLENNELWAIVNNAGIFRGLDAELCSMEHYKFCIDVNAIGPVRVTKAFLPLLRHSKGRVVNVNSLAGRYSVPYMAPYCMSKWASVTFTECLKQEMAKWGVTVISVEPEFFQTSLVQGDMVSLLYQDVLNDVEDDVKRDYGENAMKRTMNIVEKIFKNSSPRCELVVNALDSAVSSESPASVYKPCRNWLLKFLLYLGEQSPKCYVQAVNKLFM